MFIFHRFVDRVFLRSVTRGVQKYEHNIYFYFITSIWAHHKKCGVFLLGFFVLLPRLFCSIFSRVFGRFKTRLKKHGNFFRSRQKLKKYLQILTSYLLTYLRHFFFFNSFLRPPLNPRHTSLDT
jgi:hypothetical protein